MRGRAGGLRGEWREGGRGVYRRQRPPADRALPDSFAAASTPPSRPRPGSTGTPLRDSLRRAAARRVPRPPAPSSWPAAPPPKAARRRTASGSAGAPSPTRLRAALHPVPSDKRDPGSYSLPNRYTPAFRESPLLPRLPGTAAPTAQSVAPALRPASPAATRYSRSEERRVGQE